MPDPTAPDFVSQLSDWIMTNGAGIGGAVAIVVIMIVIFSIVDSRGGGDRNSLPPDRDSDPDADR